jgi:hypothetical protein
MKEAVAAGGEQALAEPKQRRVMRWFRKHMHASAVLLGPLSFSFTTGHLRSALKGRAVDRHGDALPWYSYPAIRFLSQLHLSGADVLEFGGGQSTIWWGKRAKSVTTIETNPTWCKLLSTMVGANTNVVTVNSSSQAEHVIGDRTFDVIIVDDGSGDGPQGRYANMLTAFQRLRKGGMIVVDNSSSWYSANISNEAARRGWKRIDFVGYAPGGVTEYATSVFFEEGPEMLTIGAPPKLPS